jgi:hypothetical protein
MVIVYVITAPNLQATRLHLPQSQWGFDVRERLARMGYVVAATTEPCHPDTRDAAELARRDAILEWAAD